MRRRDFIGLVGGAVAWPLGADAQQQPAMPVIGFLLGSSRETDFATIAFRRGLSDAGYVAAQDIPIEHRYADGNYERLPRLAAELKSLPVALIVANPSTAAMAAKRVTSTIPIVFFIGVDPVGLGLVASYNKPGSNVTGVALLTNDLDAKRMELLHELLPKIVPFAVLINPSNPIADEHIKTLERAAQILGRKIFPVAARSRNEIESAFETIAQRKAALIVWQENYLTSQRELIVSLSERHAIPSMYGLRLFTEIGGLISYGPDVREMYRLTGVYAGKILNGALPAELPVLMPTTYELVINIKTAKALGLEMPPTLLARANELIE